METLFKQHLPMLRKFAWRASKKWKIEYNEAESQAFEIFMETVSKFDGRCLFSTYLFHRLRKLDTVNNLINRKVKYNVEFVDHDDNLFNVFEKRLEFYDSIETELTEDAKEILNWILNCEDKKRPCYDKTEKHYKEKGWIPSRIRKAWMEIKSWWQENNFAFGL